MKAKLSAIPPQAVRSVVGRGSLRDANEMALDAPGFISANMLENSPRHRNLASKACRLLEASHKDLYSDRSRAESIAMEMEILAKALKSCQAGKEVNRVPQSLRIDGKWVVAHRGVPHCGIQYML